MAKNLLTDNQASVETNLTGITANTNTTVTRDTTEYVHGAASIKSVCANVGASEGFSTTSANVTASLAYTASVYVKGSGTVRLILNERSAADGNLGSSNILITLTDTWTRYSVSRTFGATAAKARLLVQTDVAQAITFNADKLQVEQGSPASDWRLPSEGSASPSASPSPAPARISRFISSVPPIF